MSQSTKDPGSGQEPSIGALVGQLTESLSRLLRDELQLLQAQIAEKGKSVGIGGGLLAGAGVFALFGLGWLFTAAMLALATVLPYWAAALIVAGGILLITAILALVGKTLLKKGPTPQPKDSVMKDVEAIKQGVGK
ncbi:phage holin family protein [Ruania alba]|uniref:Putative Holin-X, holin superfamily III n=1 Tax=Ruania alba TaxID=648782 RepID=A0A1H5KD56_9MICO|nr:phage holin family protein [Ruania alba]SEE62041.1 Putative Holin-X, holin superfamily III [Ruania alba]